MSRISKTDSRLREHQDAVAHDLYANRVKVYPKTVRGPMRRIKWAVLITCLAVYYVLPWVRWYRGPNQPTQAVLLDISMERFCLFDLQLWPQAAGYGAARWMTSSRPSPTASAAATRMPATAPCRASAPMAC